MGPDPFRQVRNRRQDIFHAVIAGLRLNWLLQSGAVIPAAAKVVRIDIDQQDALARRAAGIGGRGAGVDGEVSKQRPATVRESRHVLDAD